MINQKKSEVLKYVLATIIVGLIFTIFGFLYYEKQSIDFNIGEEREIKEIIEQKILFSCFSNKNFQINEDNFNEDNLENCIGYENVFLKVSLIEEEEIIREIFLQKSEFVNNLVFCNLEKKNLFCSLDEKYEVDILDGDEIREGIIKIDMIIRN